MKKDENFSFFGEKLNVRHGCGDFHKDQQLINPMAVTLWWFDLTTEQLLYSSIGLLLFINKSLWFLQFSHYL